MKRNIRTTIGMYFASIFKYDGCLMQKYLCLETYKIFWKGKGEMKKEIIGIVGTGNIGACMATLSIGNGLKTTVVVHSRQGKQRCMKIVRENFTDLKSYGLVTDENIQAAMKLLKISFDYEDLQTADFILEATSENLKIKKEVYENIERVCSEDTIIASSTSSITADELARLVRVKERLVVTHPFQPAHLLPLVELVGSRFSTPKVMERARGILEKLKRKVVTLHKDIPGFIVNRLAQAMFRESLYMVEQGVATVEDIDKSIKYAVGMRYASIGLLEYFDAVGFELERDIALNVYPSLCNTEVIQDIVKKGISDGNTGMDAGKGLYDWSDSAREDFRKRKIAPYLESFDWELPF